MSTTPIIGMDCATQEAKRGLAYGLLKDNKLTITDVASCSSVNPSQEIISNWLNRPHFTLLTLDAPLGWPSAMSETLPYYKRIPEYIVQRTREMIPAELLGIIDSFNERFLGD